MANSKTGTGNTQDEPGVFCSARKQDGVLKKSKAKLNSCVDMSISKRHRSQLKELPMPKLGQRGQQNE